MGIRLRSITKILYALIALSIIVLDCKAAPTPIENGETLVNPAEVIDAWSYYTPPPYQIEPATEAGLSRDLVDYLNRHLTGAYRLKLQLIPKARLNFMIDQGDRGIVLFTPDVVFGGEKDGRHLWSSILIGDRQEVLSRKDHPVDFTGPSSLYSVPLGCILGHVYPVIQADIDAGKIVCQRTSQESSLFQMLMHGHVAAISLPSSTMRYFLKEDPKISNWLYVSAGNLGEFQRRLMFQKGMTHERNDIDKIVQQMRFDPVWIAILVKYGLQTP